MNETERFISISKVLTATKSFGPTFLIDYSIKSKVSNELLEHVVQAICMFDIIQWVGRLPVTVIRKESEVIYDDLTVLRHIQGPITNKIEEDVIPASEMEGSALSEPCNTEDDMKQIGYTLEVLKNTLSILQQRYGEG